MSNLRTITEKVDHAIINSRLNGLAAMMMTDRDDRLKRIAASLSSLKSGAYLIGTGPSTVGIIPLTVEEVVLGRSATPVEAPADVIVDYQADDTMYLGPYEVSRVHAKVTREETPSETQFSISDLGSKCGTFVNGEVLDSDGDEQLLRHGDAISLGSTHVSTYLFVVIE